MDEIPLQYLIPDGPSHGIVTIKPIVQEMVTNSRKLNYGSVKITCGVEGIMLLIAGMLIYESIIIVGDVDEMPLPNFVRLKSWHCNCFVWYGGNVTAKFRLIYFKVSPQQN